MPSYTGGSGGGASSATSASSSVGSSAGASGGGLGGVTGIVGSIIGIGTSIYEGYLNKKVYKANAALAEAQGNYASAVEEYNAAVARANAIAIRSIADFDIERQKKAATTYTSGQVAGYSKAGVKLSGSAIDVMIESAQQAKLDIAITDYNAKIGIAQMKSQEQQFNISGQIERSNAEAKGKLLRSSGKSSVYQGYASALNQTSSLLSKVGSYSR
jgi:hypothetical protein